jgi:toxin FitB
MPGTAVDTSVVVAALLAWHEHHEAAFGCLEQILSSEGAVLLPLPVLVESYSVLTRLPAPNRLSPSDAHALLSNALRARSRLVGLEPENAWSFLASLADNQVAGGVTYDAQIASCARNANADRLVTLNLRHFQRFGSDMLEILSPLG